MLLIFRDYTLKLNKFYIILDIIRDYLYTPNIKKQQQKIT